MKSPAYQELRKQGTPAADALFASKLLDKVQLSREGAVGHKSVALTITIGHLDTPELKCPTPLVIRMVRVAYTKENAWARWGLTMYGTFTNKKREGAFAVWPPHLRGVYGHWFLPHTTEEDWVTLLRARDESKAEAARLAAEYVQRDLRRALTFSATPTAGCWWFETLQVSVTQPDSTRVLYNTRVMGIESDADDLYVLSMAAGLMQGWVDEAVLTLTEGDP